MLYVALHVLHESSVQRSNHKNKEKKVSYLNVRNNTDYSNKEEMRDLYDRENNTFRDGQDNWGRIFYSKAIKADALIKQLTWITNKNEYDSNRIISSYK